MKTNGHSTVDINLFRSAIQHDQALKDFMEHMSTRVRHRTSISVPQVRAILKVPTTEVTRILKTLEAVGIGERRHDDTLDQTRFKWKVDVIDLAKELLRVEAPAMPDMITKAYTLENGETVIIRLPEGHTRETILELMELILKEQRQP